jgi:hypothetical protein
LWKLNRLEDACEDYGHIATYSGEIAESPFKFELDGAHIFHRNKPERVCGNTALMLSHTRFKKCFNVTGNFEKHSGEFEKYSTTDKKGSDDNPILNMGNCC